MHPPDTYAVPVIDGIFFVDNSTITNYFQCNRNGYYTINRRRKSAKVKWALEYGRRMHKAMEVRYTDSMSCMLASPNVTTEMQEQLHQLWQKSPEPEGEWRHLDLACATVEKYNKQYGAESFSVLELPSGQQACELAFALPLTTIVHEDGIPVWDIKTNELYLVEELPIFFTGRIDLITREHDETLLVTDHKTTSIGGSSIFDEYFTGSQMKGYCWAGARLLGQRIHGARINIIGARRPTKTTQHNCFFDRQNIYYDQTVIDEWEQNMILLITQFVNDTVTQQFPMRTTACVTKFGRCPYYDVCQLPPNQREFLLTSGEYTDITWDPTEDDGNSLDKKQPVATAADLFDKTNQESLQSIRDYIDG